MSVMRFIRWVVRWTVRSAVVVGIGTLVARLLRQGQDGATDTTRATAETPAPDSAWVEPMDGACPTSHPVKLKESSGIFHLPGGMAYDRTVPDRCYRDAETATADGYRQAKR